MLLLIKDHFGGQELLLTTGASDGPESDDGEDPEHPDEDTNTTTNNKGEHSAFPGTQHHECSGKAMGERSPLSEVVEIMETMGTVAGGNEYPGRLFATEIRRSYRLNRKNTDEAWSRLRRGLHFRMIIRETKCGLKPCGDLISLVTERACASFPSNWVHLHASHVHDGYMGVGRSCMANADGAEAMGAIDKLTDDDDPDGGGSDLRNGETSAQDKWYNGQPHGV